MPARPLFSLVSAARNDNYMGDYLWRLSTCLNYLAWNLQNLGGGGRLDDVEVVIVDWDSQVPLHQVMPLTQAAAKIARFIIIPPDIAKSFNFDSTFPSPFITNVGLRRAQGEFIVNIEADTCFVPSALASLFDILEGKIPLGIPLREAYCVFSRRQVPVARTLRKPTVHELDQYLSRARVLLPMDQMAPGNSGRGGGVVMHRDLWHAAQGLDQTCIHWGWNDCDLHLRITQNHQWLDLANFGVDVIHLEHYAGKQGRASGPPRKLNPEIIPTRPVHEDQAHWGMAGHELPEACAVHTVPDEILHASLHVPGAVEAWDLSFADITQQLNSRETSELRAAVIRDWDASLFFKHPSPALQLGAYPAFEADAIAWLAWYALSRHPRNYLEIGSRWGFAACVVATGCPGVEFYGLDSWRAVPLTDPTVWFCSNIFLACTTSHHGTQSYTRFITGDPRTSVHRLFSGSAAPQTIDLAFIRTDPAHGDAFQNASEIADQLASGGMMVLFSSRPTELTNLMTSIRDRYPNFYYITTSFGLCGVILAATLNPT